MSDRADMLGRAAQAWCTADTQDIELNPALAEAFADILAADLAAAEERGRREGREALRKELKGFRDSGVADALVRFIDDFNNAETTSSEESAYERFLSAILGVPYARVGE